MRLIAVGHAVMTGERDGMSLVSDVKEQFICAIHLRDPSSGHSYTKRQ
jgi:hypothetical protein